MRTALERGGFPELGADFFKADEVPQQGARMRLTLTEDTFAVAYHENDAWYVGWSGPVEHNGTEVSGKIDRLHRSDGAGGVSSGPRA